MKRNVLRGLRSSLLLFLWLLLVQFISAVLVTILILVTHIGHLLGPTPLWVQIIIALPICLFWLVMGVVTPDVVQLRPAGLAAVLLGWAIVTALMRSVYLLFLPQQTCSGMLLEILKLLFSGPTFLKDDYQNSLIGFFLLPVTFGAGILLGQKRRKAKQNE